MTRTVTKKSLIGHFSALDDPRQAWKVEYRLPEIMLLVLCATLAGAETIVETALWGRKKLDFLRGLLPFKRGVPSHDALNDVINALDAELLCACFSAWVEGLRESEPDIVAIDGKTSRRAHARQGHALHTVSAWAARQRLVLGQQATEQKSNEITAIPLLLERLQLSGALVTIEQPAIKWSHFVTPLDRGLLRQLARKKLHPGRQSQYPPGALHAGTRRCTL